MNRNELNLVETSWGFVRFVMPGNVSERHLISVIGKTVAHFVFLIDSLLLTGELVAASELSKP
jgi:hypothetical protein